MSKVTKIVDSLSHNARLMKELAGKGTAEKTEILIRETRTQVSSGLLSDKYINTSESKVGKTEHTKKKSIVTRLKQLFGLSERSKKTRQTAPSQKLPDVIDVTCGGKAEAEVFVFGNGTLADIKPSIVKNATEELTKHYGREIKASDLQVVRTSNGAFISYFDPETRLATTFSNSGELNGQYRIRFDAQGNIQAFGLESIYMDGKFLYVW